MATIFDLGSGYVLTSSSSSTFNGFIPANEAFVGFFRVNVGNPPITSGTGSQLLITSAGGGADWYYTIAFAGAGITSSASIYAIFRIVDINAL